MPIHPLLPIAAPSCVIPAPVADNARFLSGRVQEVGLCLFESQSCLDYTLEDMPFSLRDLPLSWHLHLPVDLPWEAGGAAAAALALAVSQQARFLEPGLAVLHPPVPPSALGGHTATQSELLRAFAHMWRRYSTVPVLLENVSHCSLLDLAPQLFAPDGESAFGVCLDVGHMLAYDQKALLHREDLLERVALTHWSAPGVEGKDQHLPLTQLTEAQRIVAKQAAELLPPMTIHMLEIFHWAGVEHSWPVLQHLLER